MTDRALRHVVTTQLPGIDGDGITTAEKEQLISDVGSVSLATDLLSYNTFDPSDPKYGGVRGAVDNAQRIINSNAINMAADDARDAGGTLVIKGTYECNSGVQFQCHVDAGDGELHFFDQSLNPAVLVGHEITGTNLTAKHIVLPAIRQQGKVTDGWAGNDVGLRIGNLYQSFVTVTGVYNFRTNIEMFAIGTGNVYNVITLGVIFNHLIGLNFRSSGASGWVNENVFIGGRFHITSSEGTNITGARHIRVPVSATGNPFNNNYFLKPSVEGNGPEYHVEIAGNYNTVEQGRWEASPPKLLWGSGIGNVINGGYGAQNIQFTGDGKHNRLQGMGVDMRYQRGYDNGLIALASTNSINDSLIKLKRPGTFWDNDWATNWTWNITAAAIEGKVEADTQPRIKIDSQTGRVYFGDGTAEPAIFFTKTTSVPIDTIATNGAFRVRGEYTRPLIIGDIYLWKNGSNVYKKVGSPPTSSSDGTIAF